MIEYALRLLASWGVPIEPDCAEALWFRMAIAALVGLLMTLNSGQRCIEWLQRQSLAAADRQRPFQPHERVAPTMGGMFLVSALIIVIVLCCDWRNRVIWLATALLAMLGMLATGEDLTKLRAPRLRIGGFSRVLAQSLVVLPITWLLYLHYDAWPAAQDFQLPLLDTWNWGGWFVPIAMFVLIISASACNATDQSDGLAAGCAALASLGLSVLAYWVGDVDWSERLNLIHIADARELAVLLLAVTGLSVGFLRFNGPPARVHLGMSGTLPLGALLGFVAVALRMEWAWLVIGGVFALQAISAATQIPFFAWGDGPSALAESHLNAWLRLRRTWYVAVGCAVIGLALVRVQSWHAFSPGANVEFAQQSLSTRR